jgi:hypothetical protein
VGQAIRLYKETTSNSPEYLRAAQILYRIANRTEDFSEVNKLVEDLKSKQIPEWPSLLKPLIKKQAAASSSSSETKPIVSKERNSTDWHNKSLQIKSIFTNTDEERIAKPTFGFNSNQIIGILPGHTRYHENDSIVIVDLYGNIIETIENKSYYQISFSNNRKFMAISTEYDNIEVYDNNYNLIFKIASANGRFPAISSDGNLIAYSVNFLADPKLYIYNRTTTKYTNFSVAHSTEKAFTPDDQYLIAVSDRQLMIFDKNLKIKCPAPVFYANSLAVNHDNTHVISSTDSSLNLTDINCNLIWEKDGTFSNASFSPDGKYILAYKAATKEEDGEIRIYDLTGELINTFTGYSNPYFSPDGNSILAYDSKTSSIILIEQ